MLRFTLFKIPVSVHWMFWALAAFLGGGLRANSAEDWHRVIVFILAVFVSILVHEFGHALAGIRLGAGAPAIQLHGFGGAAQFRHNSMSRRQRILMTLAGPGASVILALVFYTIAVKGFAGVALDSYSIVLVAYFVNVMIIINLFWTTVNLFPVLPLDGGQILREVLGPERLRITCIISLATLVLLACLLWIGTRSIYNMIVMVLLGSYTWSLLKQTSR